MNHKGHRDYAKTRVATFIVILFLSICVRLDYKGSYSQYLGWVSFTEDIMVPLIPLIVIIIYLHKLSHYLLLNPSYAYNHRIHHYHIGLLSILIGVLLSAVQTGTEIMLLNGKLTTPQMISQGLGYCFLIGGVAFIILDINDIRQRIRRKPSKVIEVKVPHK